VFSFPIALGGQIAPDASAGTSRLGRIGVFGIGTGSVSSDPKSRMISLANAPLTLDAQTAQTFNDAFAEGKAVFAAGEIFGTVSFGAVGQ
jgi:hypothetical protein